MKQDQASATAYTVLQGLLLVAGRPDYQGLVTRDTCAAGRQIMEASDEGQRRLRQLESHAFRWGAALLERLVMPGITLHYALRKRYIEEQVVHALATGVTQVVNLGAGFDTLVWQLHSNYPQVSFIELDHPATSAIKTRALQQREADNLHLLAVDLARTELTSALRGCAAFDPARPTLFLCEGVLMYLEPAAVNGLFAALKTLTGRGTRCLFSAVEPMDSEENNAGLLLQLYLKLKSEPLGWFLPKSVASGYLQQQGYVLDDLVATERLEQRYLGDLDHGVLHRGEYLVLASAE